MLLNLATGCDVWSSELKLVHSASGIKLTVCLLIHMSTSVYSDIELCLQSNDGKFLFFTYHSYSRWLWTSRMYVRDKLIECTQWSKTMPHPFSFVRRQTFTATLNSQQMCALRHGFYDTSPVMSAGCSRSSWTISVVRDDFKFIFRMHGTDGRTSATALY